VFEARDLDRFAQQRLRRLVRPCQRALIPDAPEHREPSRPDDRRLLSSV
jgi:hypothetical protein